MELLRRALIGERAATRGRVAMEGGDERGGANGGYSFALQPLEPDRPAEPRAVGGAALPEGLDERFASAPVLFVAGNDAPLIGERAATRGRSATEGAVSTAV